MADIAQRRTTERGELRVTGLLDAGKGFIETLEELRVIRRARRQAGRQVRIRDRKAFADGGKGVVVGACRLRRVERGFESGQLFGREELHECLAAAVRGASRQPGVADPMAIDAEFRREDRPVAQEFEHDGRAQRRGGFARLRGTAGEESSATVGRARGDGDTFGDPEGDGGLRGDLPDRSADRDDFGEDTGRQSEGAQPIRPFPGDRVIARLQCVVLIGLPVRRAKAAVDPVCLMKDAV